MNEGCTFELFLREPLPSPDGPATAERVVPLVLVWCEEEETSSSCSQTQLVTMVWADTEAQLRNTTLTHLRDLRVCVCGAESIDGFCKTDQLIYHHALIRKSIYKGEFLHLLCW